MQLKIDNFDLTPAIRGFKGTSGLQLTRAHSNQVAGGLRASHVRNHDRKNRQHTMTFTAHYEFARADECEAWLLDLDETMPNQGLVVVTTGAAGRIKQRWIPDAAITCSGQSVGLLAIVQFQITYGQILKEAP